MRELEREAELEEKAPKVKAKSKMSKVFILKLERKWYMACAVATWAKTYIYLFPLTGWEGSYEEAEKAGISAGKTKI